MRACRSITTAGMFLVLLSPLVAVAQSDAQDSYKKAKTAYTAEQFTTARDLLIKASQTAPRNPDIFLLLGKSHYQLGDIPQAITAWQRTLQLAPKQAYAKKMLEQLRGKLKNIDTQIRVIETLIQENLLTAAQSELTQLRQKQSLNKQQLEKALALQADLYFRGKQIQNAAKALQELKIRNPKQLQSAPMMILNGRVKLALGGNSVKEGLAILQAAKKRFPKTASSVKAEFEILAFQIPEGKATIADLLKWADNSGKVHLTNINCAGRLEQLINKSLLDHRNTAPAATAQTALTKADRTIINLVNHTLPLLTKTTKKQELINRLFNHIHNKYHRIQAHTAIIAAKQLVLNKLPILKKGTPNPLRESMLSNLGYSQRSAAITELKTALTEGFLKKGPLPKSIQTVLKTYQTIDQQFPQRSIENEQITLATQLLEISAATPWAKPVTELQPTDQWAVEILLPLVKKNKNAKAITKISQFFEQLIRKYTRMEKLKTAQLAAATHHRFHQSLSPKHLQWGTATNRQIMYWLKASELQFHENNRLGRQQLNQKLTPLQKQTLALAAELFTKSPVYAKLTLPVIVQSFQPWQQQKLDTVVEAAYAQLEKSLPQNLKQRVHILVVNNWKLRVFQQHQKLLTQNFQPPRKLDKNLTKSLKRCYELLRNTDKKSDFAQAVLRERNSIIAHYRLLKYNDTAEAAIQIKSQPAIGWVDAQIAWDLANFHTTMAIEELAQHAKLFRGRKQLTLTPAILKSIADYKSFIKKYPQHEFIAAAVKRIFEIGRHYEMYEKYNVATKIYTDFETFAATQKAFAHNAEGTISVSEQAAQFATIALHTAASKELKTTMLLKGTDGNNIIPQKLSKPFAATIAAYNRMIKKYPNSPLVASAIGKLLAIGVEYAKVGAWDVANSVYADLQKQKLQLQQPENLKFARALCELGKVLPDHARKMLSAITLHDRIQSALTDNLLEVQIFADLSDKEAEETDESNPFKITNALTSKYLQTQLDFQAQLAKKKSSRIEALPRGMFGVRYSLSLDRDEYAAVPGWKPIMLEPKDRTSKTGDSKKGDSTSSDTESGDIFGGGRGRTWGDLSAREIAKRKQAPEKKLPSAYREALEKITTKTGKPPTAQLIERSKKQGELFAAIRKQQLTSAARVANLRGDLPFQNNQSKQRPSPQEMSPFVAANGTMLSAAEIARQQKVLDTVYAAFQAIRKLHPQTQAATQSREEIFVILNHWRSIKQWQRAATLAKRFLKDNPRDGQLINIRHEIARDYLASATHITLSNVTNQKLFDAVNKRFTTARKELTNLIVAFPKNKTLKHQAQWDIANSYLSQARVIANASDTLARGQYVRAANELLQTTKLYHDHPQIGQIPQLLWNITTELTSRHYYDEAITVWDKISLHYPGHALAEQAALRIAQTYQHQLHQPLRAVESYLELNASRGGHDGNLQNLILQIAVQLKSKKRWVESLHIFEVFVDNFPQHNNAGHALTMIGQIHQANEVWKDAITAYQRVIRDYNRGQWAQEANWSIAECTINLSQWDDARKNYNSYQKSYPRDRRVATARKRLEILKDLSRYQRVADEKGQRKAFDAQYQIGSIMHKQLANPVKAIIEYKKVAAKWPKSHLADDALFQVGLIHMQLGESEQARKAFLATATQYPSSPLADDALFQVGTSFSNQAQLLASVTRSKSAETARNIAQKFAYEQSQQRRNANRKKGEKQIEILRNQGKSQAAEALQASNVAQNASFDQVNAYEYGNKAAKQEVAITASQLADRQDKINAALRKAVAGFRRSANVASADKAGDALLRMAEIYDLRLKDSDAAMKTWLEIVKQYSGTTVAEDASWKIAQFYENHKKHAQAIAAYKSFLKNYRRSPHAGAAQFAIAENQEHLGNWVKAMDAYTNYITNFPSGSLINKAKEQINWIKTYRL